MHNGEWGRWRREAGGVGWSWWYYLYVGVEWLRVRLGDAVTRQDPVDFSRLYVFFEDVSVFLVEDNFCCLTAPRLFF